MILENKQETEVLERVLASQATDLNERERLVLSLHLQGYSNKEIAKTLHVAAQLISVELNAVRNKMKYRVKNWEPKPRKKRSKPRVNR